MTRWRAVLIAVLSFVCSYAYADITGTWNGTLSGQKACGGGTTVAQSFPVEFDLLQSGSLVIGIIQATGPQDPCKPGSPTDTIQDPLNGSVSGSTFSGTFIGVENGKVKSFSATVNGTSMSITADTLSGTLTQTSTQAPASGLTGTYTGSYTATLVPCGTLPPITYSGSVTLGPVQVGSAIIGYVTITNGKKDDNSTGTCVVTSDPNPETAQISAMLSGNTITGFVVENKEHPLTATVSGNTISGSVIGDFPGESTTFTVTLTSSGIPGPAFTGFSVNPSTISAGQSATLTWTTLNATSVSIDQGVGTQPASGSVNVSPAQTATYTLTATGPGGTATLSATVTVTAGQPMVVVGQLPGGMIEVPGTAAATDSFTLSNVGLAPANVTLTQSGNFFTFAPATFTLGPAASQTVEITATAQPAGTYDGSIAISSGPTVPVHLLVAAPPTAPVNPQPANPRSDVAAPAGQNPFGSASFTNSGSGGVTAIAVADVPWIVPQSGAINIGPGQTTTVNFNIDRSKRPDSAAPVGGVAGKISLVYLLPVASKTAVPLGNPPTGSVSVTIVDVVKPNAAPGTPPPLQPGQVALFIDGLRTANRFNGDLTISSRPTVPSISDLQIFLSTGGNAQVSAIPSFASSAGLTFPAINKNVFGVTGTGGGSLQARSTQTPSVALSGVVSLNAGSPDISSATALPILRSDRAIGTGERLVFSGVQDSLTTVWIQEVSGNPGHVSIQYLDANGATMGTDSGVFPAFAAGTSGAPDGARSAVVTNDSTGGGRFDGYASINDPTTSNGWVLTDSLHHWGSASGSLIMPIVSAAPNDVYVTNTSNAAASVTLEFDSGLRRRATKGGANRVQSFSIPPMGTSKTTFAASTGFVRITSASPLTAAGRVTLSSSGASFGSSLPAIPASAALGSGQGKRFTGVDDASVKTVGAKTPLTYRSTLMLIEASGQSATVHVTLTYIFAAGATVSSVGMSSRDFAIGPNEMITITELARAIIGPQRDAFGDLRNMQVDVDVTGGSGNVLPFIESTDNASRDIMVRAE